MSLRILRYAACALAAVCASPAIAHAQQDEIADADRAFDAGDYDKAAGIYDRIIREHGTAAGCGVYGKRVAVHFLRKQYTDGLRLVEQSGTCRASTAVQEQHAVLLWALGKRKEAAGTAEQVVRQRPAAFSNQKILGDYYAQSAPEKAIVAFRAYLRHRPRELSATDATPRIMLAFSCLAVAAREPKRRRELLKDAREQLQFVEQQFGRDAEARFNAQTGLCAVYTALGEWARAVTTCERVRQIRRGRSAQASTWFNLSLAYLNSRRPEQARASALEFIDRGGEQARGFELVGDSYAAQQNKWDEAVRYYQMAEERGRAGRPELAAKIGRAYRQLKRLDKAEEKLQAAWKADQTDPGLAIELGEVLNARDKHDEAMAVVRSLLPKPGEKGGAIGLLLVAGEAELGRKKYTEARAYFEQVLAQRNDARARRGMIRSFNVEALVQLQAGRAKEASATLRNALKYEPGSPQTNRNLAVLAIESGDCGRAREHLEVLKKVGSQQVTYHRLAARAYLCDRNRAEAARLYAKGAEIARKANNNLALAEIYVEWAPLTFGTDLDGAIDKLNDSVQFSYGVPEVAAAARRNRARAYYLRGVQRLTAGEAARARGDLEAATSDPKALEGDELDSCKLALALARAEGREVKAAVKELQSLSSHSAGLTESYSSLDSGFFVAYARYRSDDADDVEAAARSFAAQAKSGRGPVRNLARQLAGHAYLKLSRLQREAGRTSAASAALADAQPLASGDDRAMRVLRHNQIVLKAARGAEDRAKGALSALKDPPVEALVNLGVAYDVGGDGKRAVELWRQAKSKGYRSKLLEAWIDAKQRIFKY